jgi:tRNA(Arg) A34 adenosine deaminase TadA
MYVSEIMDFVVKSAENLEGLEVPVFAAVAVGTRVIASASNKVEESSVVWAHAEFLAIQNACEAINSRYLDMASIYINLEPCALCAAVIEKVRLKALYFGAYDPKRGAVVHNARIFDHSDRSIEIVGGIQEQRCSNLITNFFKELRCEKNLG